MRLKNIRGAKDIVLDSKYTIKNPVTNKGKYSTLFNNNHPIHIEIGMGKGSFIINMALKYPNINFIGLEKYASVQIQAIKKLKEASIPNLLFINEDAIDIDTFFDHEIDTIYLNFSDPWPKLRHAKRRLTSPIFLSKYDLISNNKTHIIMKTDNRKLFEYSILMFSETKYNINNISLNLYQDNVKDNIPTEYEVRFSQKGDIIYMIDVLK